VLHGVQGEIHVGFVVRECRYEVRPENAVQYLGDLIDECPSLFLSEIMVNVNFLFKERGRRMKEEPGGVSKCSKFLVYFLSLFFIQFFFRHIHLLKELQ